MKLHGREIKVGDKVWSVTQGWGKCSHGAGGADYPIYIDFGSGNKASFTESGKRFINCATPELYWNEIPLPDPTTVEPPKAKRKLYMWAREDGLCSSGWGVFFGMYENEDDLRKEYDLDPSKKVQRLDYTMIEVE